MKGQNATMPANLQKAVQSSLSAFLQQRLDSDGDIAQDVYRTLRDEANLLLERQLVCDALDTDPFELVRMSAPAESTPDDGDGETDGNEEELLEKKKNGEMIARFKVRKEALFHFNTECDISCDSIHHFIYPWFCHYSLPTMCIIFLCIEIFNHSSSTIYNHTEYATGNIMHKNNHP